MPLNSDALRALEAQGDRTAGLGVVAELLERNGIDPAMVGRVQKISLYQTITNAEGEIAAHDLAAVQLSPAWEAGPEWPVVQPGPPVRVAKPSTFVVAGEWATAVVWPDMQIGFYRTPEGLVPTHDPVAIELALTATKVLKPDVVVLVGDNLDLPEFGKYRQSPAFQRTTQATIDYATVLMGRIRGVAPEARIVWIAGNHEERLPNYILDNASAAFGIRQGATPGGWPVLSVPHLCRLDETGVEYLPGYPAAEYWLNEGIKIIHGTRVNSNGSTAHRYLDGHQSVVYGHIHRREWAERTHPTRQGTRTVIAATPGCLARCDGAVPSTKGSVDLDGRPLTVVENWQQGLGIITYQPDGWDHDYEHVTIRHGRMRLRGKQYTA